MMAIVTATVEMMSQLKISVVLKKNLPVRIINTNAVFLDRG